MSKQYPYSKGFQQYVEYDGLLIPEKDYPKIEILARNTLRKNEFGVHGNIVHTRKNGIHNVAHLLTTSEDFTEINPINRTLKRSLVTCDDTKDGFKTFDAFIKSMKQIYGVTPTHRESQAVMTKKEFVPKEQLYSSVSSAIRAVPLSKTKDNYVVCVFFDIPKKKIDEDMLETIITGSLEPDKRKPTTELVHRFDGMGYTLIGVYKNLKAAKHSFMEYNSLLATFIGPAKSILPAMFSLEKRLHSRTGYLSMNRMA